MPARVLSSFLQGGMPRHVTFAALSPRGSAPRAQAEPEVALLCSSPLLLLYSSLVHLLDLDPHNISHLVRFRNTKSHCLLRNLCSGEVALLLEHSAGLPRVLLLCWQVQVRLEQPLSLDRGTAQIFFPCFALSNHNPEVSHSEPTPRKAPVLWQGGDLEVPLAGCLYGSDVLSFGLEALMSFLALNLLMSFSVKPFLKVRGSVKMRCPKHTPREAPRRGKQRVKSRALLPAGDTGA